MTTLKAVRGAMTRVGVALSGGGHRASVWAAGLLLYLADAGRNGDVGTIASVSGGSITNGVPSGTRVRVLGGGTIVFDQFGRAKYHHRKDIRDVRRQQRRLSYLVRNGLSDDDSLVTALRQRTSLSATMDLQPGVTHVELAAPAFGDAPFTVVSSG
jgi:hypothetical protein